MKISLHLLAKDEINQVATLCDIAKPYFDAIFLTVSDEKAYKALKKALPKVKVDYRPWNDRFDEARQHNWELGKDYEASMWIDADDSFEWDRIPELVSLLEDNDVVFLPYHYDFDDNGNVIVNLTRERLVRRDKGFYWKGWVHENLISDQNFIKTSAPYPVIHNQTKEHHAESLARNHAILTKAYQETNDPRYIHYLGISFFTMKEFEKAIETLEEYISVGGWDEEIYRSAMKIAESYFMLGQVDRAVLEALKAISILPTYPAAYHLITHLEYQQENLPAAIEWAKIALSKKDPENISIYDPTARDRTMLTLGMCYFQTGQFQKAYNLIKNVTTIDTSEVLEPFKYQAEAEVFAKLLPGLFQFYDKPQVLWESLTDELKYAPEFRKIRESLTHPKKWADNTVVFFCGKGYEEWGPHTLDEGMGGSEEAIVYLAPQLTKLGYDVTIFGEVSEPLIAGGVQWLPWNYIDRRDHFSTMIVWRMPEFTTQFKADKMFVDMHDLVPTKLVKPYPGVTYLFKSQYHKDYYPEITDYQIIPNGVEVSQFKTADKKPFSVIYPSAYYRGLEPLLDMWPTIKGKVPEATLDVYYGWQSWVANEGEDAFYKRVSKKLEHLKDLGVTEHGRVSHKVLAEKYAESKVWAYPTEFPEIFCITAVKANLAGCKPVITDVAALKETGGPSADFIETDSIYRDQYSREKFINKLVKALKEEHDTKEQIKWAKQFDWSKVAEQWQGAINGKV